MRPCSLFALVLVTTLADGVRAEPLQLHLRSRTETVEKSGRYHAVTESKAWDPKQTAIVVCDMWDTQPAPTRRSELGRWPRG
jgi:hypothetical protein